MAHIVGVPKREPCQQCGHPVFFAERLTIGKFLYHRTCLKCARCGTQLTPGSFYETETDGVFCCETCPDEEKKIQLAAEHESVHKSLESIAQEQPHPQPQQQHSITEKIAIFQTNGKGLLQKSMSDEEKSKSLKKLSELSEIFSKNSIQETTDAAAASTTTEDSSDSSSDSDDSSEDEDAPALPKTAPPPPNEIAKPQLPPLPSKVNVLNKLKMQPSPIKRPLSIDNGKNHITTNVDETTNKIDYSSQIQSIDTETISVTQNAEVAAVTTASHISSNDIISNELSTNAQSSCNDVTKEINESATIDEQKIDRINSNIDGGSSSSSGENMTNDTHVNGNTSKCEQKTVKDDDVKLVQHINSISSGDCDLNKFIDNDNNNKHTSIINNDDGDDVCIRNNSSDYNNRSNNQMVRSRLSQFEALTKTEFKQTTMHKTNSPLVNCSPTAIETRTKPQEQEQHQVAIQLNETFKENAVIDNDRSEQCSERKTDEMENPSSDTVNDVNLKNVTIERPTIGADEQQAETAIPIEKPIPLMRAVKNVDQNESDLSAMPAPTPTKRKNRVNTSEQHAEHSIEQQINDKQSNENGKNDSLSGGRDEQKADDVEYPEGLNPFGSDDEEDDVAETKNNANDAKRKDSLNPFDSSDDEIELLKKSSSQKKKGNNNTSRISTNPFGSDSEDENDTDTFSLKRTPVPTPRKPLNGSSLHSTPEPSPRMSQTLKPRLHTRPNDDFYGSNPSIASSSNYSCMSNTLNRSSQVHGSMTSLTSTPRHKKGRAPDIPTSRFSISANSSPSQSIRATPKSNKKRAAPPPPKSLNDSLAANPNGTDTPDSGNGMSSKQLTDSLVSNDSFDFNSSFIVETSIESPFTTDCSHINDSEIVHNNQQNETLEANASKKLVKRDSQRKLIAVDSSLLDEFTIKNIAERPADENVIYRRKIVAPLNITTPTDRQCEKMKENKESQNKNRQSQTVTVDESNHLFSPNKSSHGKWKRRKGPAPSLPVPPRKIIQMLPLQEIRHELEVIEVQQTGLEKQGVILEKMIRERCEGTENENKPLDEFKPNSKEVEDLILQLFELVNEKNELFRRQAELMYLRRQHRLEQEQADIEYEIRVLMAQPECNKTDTDKSNEERLISRLVEVVQLRNEVVESLEMDRIREAEEDQSIKEQLELHTAKFDDNTLKKSTPIKLSKKEKKKQKESKKLAKQKKMDADKDADETEIGESVKVKDKKKKRKFLF